MKRISPRRKWHEGFLPAAHRSTGYAERAAVAMSPEFEENCAVLLAGRPHGDLHVLAEGGQKVHEPLDREVAGLPTHQTGNVRLPDAQNRAGLGLCESPILDQPVD